MKYKKMQDGKRTDGCCGNRGVFCAGEVNCATCGFNPDVEKLRKERVRAAERDGSLRKK